jgi:hypothetical protein
MLELWTCIRYCNMLQSLDASANTRHRRFRYFTSLASLLFSIRNTPNRPEKYYIPHDTSTRMRLLTQIDLDDLLAVLASLLDPVHSN